MEWLRELRTKPKSIRDQLAFAGAATITALIALVWGISLPSHFSNLEAEEAGPEEEAIGAFAQFFSEAKDRMAAALVASDESGVATGTASSSSDSVAEGASQVVIPVLEAETIEAVTKPVGRPILIETTSKPITSSTTE